jgi:hypothetical protein
MTTSEQSTVLNGGPSMEERETRLTDGAEQLAGEQRSHPIVGHPRFLVTVAASLMTVGVTAILLGWYGAARSTLVEEQLPYLISGGLLGVSLSIVGALVLFTHWLTVSVRENRAHEAARRDDHEQLIKALRSLSGALQGEEGTNGRARGAQPQRPVRRAARSS